VGIQLLKGPGEEVRKGEELCLLLARDPGRLEEARSLMEAAVFVGGKRPPARPLVLEEIDSDALGKD
jgi:thymidine phosphorylase